MSDIKRDKEFWELADSFIHMRRCWFSNLTGTVIGNYVGDRC